MSDNEEIDEELEEEIEIFFSTLSKDDFKNMYSAKEIKSNFESMNEILEPLRDTENEFQNPSLKITKTIRSKVQIIVPNKELDEQNSNLIKDILNFQKGYEKNAEESNKTIEQVKESFKDLSESVTDLIKLIENIKNKYFEHVKEMMSPFTEKNEAFKKLSDDKLNNVKNKIDKLDNKIKLYDQNLAKIIKDLKEVFKRIKLNIEGYLHLLNNLDAPINSMIENIENIFNEFEQKSKNFIDIIFNSPKKKEQAFKIFNEIRELNKKIMALIEKQKKDLVNQDNNLKNEKVKCSKDFNEIKKLENESSKKIKDLQKETKTLISEINEILTICSLPKLDIEIKEFKGLEIDKIEKTVVEGTDNILKANTKLVVDFSKLQDFVEENNTILNRVVSLDLVFIMDITVSMANYLKFAKEKILNIIDKITKDSTVKVQLGFIGYRDKFDSKEEYLIYPELTNNYNKVKEFINLAKPGGGSDCEDMGGGLHFALNSYKWTSNTRFAILLADAPCHGEQYHCIKNLDSVPKGDPKYKIDELVKQFAEKNINLMCLNITAMTVKLYNNFVDYYKKGRKNENSSSIYVGILEEKKGTEYLLDLIVKQAKENYEKRHIYE